jgi:hypothetical protein
MIWLYFGLLLVALVAAGLLWVRMRQRGLNRWLVQYIWQTPRRRLPRDDEPVHVILCIADHFEPSGGQASPRQAMERVERWVRDYPKQFGTFRDSDGRTPRHTFFFPIEEYDPAHVDGIAGLCRAGFGEVELHLHHDGDNASHLREQLLHFKELFAGRHGLLARSRSCGNVAYGFIHGNWSLCNGRPDGRWCGVNDELTILRQTGCYADFTMPSAPHVTQCRKINSLYYAVQRPGQPRSHDTGIDVGTAPRPADSLLLVQGPLVYNLHKRKWGVVPRLENGCIQNSQPASIQRLPDWLRARVQVPARPDWFFVKLHAHGAEEASQEALLGPPMVRFHRELAEHARNQRQFNYHYVTAREMYNLIKAAEAGWTGSVADALDYELIFNGAAAPSMRERPVPLQRAT